MLRQKNKKHRQTKVLKHSIIVLVLVGAVTKKFRLIVKNQKINSYADQSL
jgi:hypothetical protein